MLRSIPLLFTIPLFLPLLATASPPTPELDRYNITWTSPSKDASESMPCGGGDIGMNVWVENGELLCYVQRSGCFDENNEYLKLGRLRLRLDPDPLSNPDAFRQELKLHQGRVEITATKGDLSAKIQIWTEIHRPIVHLDVQSNQDISVHAAYENWRTEDLSLPNNPARPRFGCLSWDGYPGPVTRFHDEIRHDANSVLFYHRNRDDKLLFDYLVRQQSLESVKDQIVNTQKGRTFGGIFQGDAFVADGTADGKYLLTPFKAWRLRSEKPAREHHLRLVSHLAQADTLQQWLDSLASQSTAQEPTRQQAMELAEAWWDRFWQRSYIRIAPDHPDENSRPWQIARNYQLFRYQLGCNALGQYPTKFNGGNFIFDPSLVDKKNTNGPDWRAWGGGSFTAQNQRLVHWPMLKSGDPDLMIPQFEFYRRALPSALARVKTYYNHDGCLFVEQLENIGLPIAAGWGWPEPAAKVRQRGKEIPFADPRADGSHGPNSLVEHGEQANAFVSYHYESQLEFSYMILENHRFFDTDLRPYLPLIEASVSFFDHHYQLRQKIRTGQPLDPRGKLVLFPSTSCESYRGAKNPSDLIAGLHACIESLLTLDDTLLSPDRKTYYRGLLSRLPDYSFDTVKGDKILKPAESWQRYQNCECPQFYSLFPFNRFNLASPEIDIFRSTWKHGAFPKDIVQSWHQDGIFFARMGMLKEAVDYNTRKLQNAPRRFPTFWGPGHDWAPDHNHGGSGMIALQEMLLQTPGQQIHLFPCWPKDWNVSFKLHAPQNTTIEATLKNGKLESLKITPESRTKDVTNFLTP